MSNKGNAIQFERADGELQASGVLGARVLVVAAKVHSSPGDIRRAAESVAKRCRALRFEGYDLRSAEVKAYLLRDDRPIEVEHELRVTRSGKLSDFAPRK